MMELNNEVLDEHQQRMHDATMKILEQPEIQLMMANQSSEMFRQEMMRCREVLAWILKQDITEEIEINIGRFYIFLPMLKNRINLMKEKTAAEAAFEWSKANPCALERMISEEGNVRSKPYVDGYVGFYEREFYVLSNFSSFRLMWKGIDFDTSEAAYHWEKFVDHPDLQNKIIHARSAHDAYRISNENRDLRRKDWDDVKVGIMLEIIRAKAQQHEYVRRKLMETGYDQLVEDSWRDDFWGWGEDRTGANWLGRLWEQIRKELRNAR